MYALVDASLHLSLSLQKCVFRLSGSASELT